MRKWHTTLWLVVAGLALFMTGVTHEVIGQDAPAAKPAEAEKPAGEAKADQPDDGLSVQDRFAYYIGIIHAHQIRAQGLCDLNPQMLAKGINDVFTDKAPPLRQEQMQAAAEAYKAWYQTYMREIAEKNAKASAEYLDANKQKEGWQTTATGLQYKVIKEGDGLQPNPTDHVKVNYEGSLIDGTVFDSSFKRGEPVEMDIPNIAIAGWKEALLMMKAGSRWEVAIPPTLAYGAGRPGPKIMPNSVLLFQIELLDVTRQAKAPLPDFPESK